MYRHCTCGWMTPTPPTPISGITTFTAPYAGAVARPFLDKMGDIFSAADFGFTPSSTAAQNVTAWNNMIAAAATREGTQIWIPSGTYTVNAPLVIDGKTNIHLLGSGPGRQPNFTGTKIVQTTAGASVIQFKDCLGSSIRDLVLTYTVDASAGVPALHLLNTFDLHVEGVGISSNGLGANPSIGIKVQRDGASSWVGSQTFLTRILHCQVGNCTSDAIQFLGTDATHLTSMAWVQGCLLIGCGGAGIYCSDHVEGIYINSGTNTSACQRGIFLDGSSLAELLQNIIIDDAVIDSSTLENVRAEFTTNIFVRNSWVATTGGTDSIFLTDCASPTVQGCFIAGGSINGLRLVNVSGASISGNLFANNASRSLHLGPGTIACRVIGNTTNNDPSAILDEGAQNPIGPNLFSPALIYLSDLLFFANLTSGNPTINFDSFDFLNYSRATNSFNITIGNVLMAQFAATAPGETSLILRDTTANTTKIVSLGATDSGGAGYKLLRIPN
jgi:hypothetical protein